MDTNTGKIFDSCTQCDFEEPETPNKDMDSFSVLKELNI